MRRDVSEVKETDIEICRKKINELLREFNCTLMSADDWSNVLIMDRDTNQTLSALQRETHY